MKFFTLLWKKTATQKTFCIAVISKMRYQENYSLLFLVGAHLFFGWMSSSVYQAKLVEIFQDLAKMLFALCIFDVLKEDTINLYCMFCNKTIKRPCHSIHRISLKMTWEKFVCVVLMPRKCYLGFRNFFFGVYSITFAIMSSRKHSSSK